MKRNECYDQYVEILREELMPALGCTEPIAIAYAAAVARMELGEFPDRMEVACSGNIIKNAKGVIVPQTENMRGIRTAAILGALGGDPRLKLEVLTRVTAEDVVEVRRYLEAGFAEEKLLDSTETLHIIVTAARGTDEVLVELKGFHTNIVRIVKNGVVVQAESAAGKMIYPKRTDRSVLSLEGILDFAENTDIGLVKDILDRQIECNLAVAEEGLNHPYGACIGATLLKYRGNTDPNVIPCAYAAAGSDARMSGCVLPVVINSGSGNQGITVSVPVIMFAREHACPEDKLYRALLISNLVAIYQKTMIGALSAFCGAVSAACGAGAAIMYLSGGSYKQIGQTIVNVLGNVAGIVCDGAKPSCAAKIAASLNAAFLAVDMAKEGNVFNDGEGIVKESTDDTMRAVGRMARRGMAETDREILRIMINA